MKKIFKYLKETPNLFLILEMIMLLSFSISFLFFSFCLTEWLQVLFISLGTGLLSSAVVSLTFWVIQYEKELRTANKRRKEFMWKFKILVYEMITYLNMASCQNEELSLEDFIKLHQRWFHEYYKKLVANNGNEDDTNLRIKQINNFIESFYVDFEILFNSRTIWEDGNFSKRQLSELQDLYKKFYESLNYSKNQNCKQLFLSFAWFLEDFKNILVEIEFKELENFKLLHFNYSEKGNLKISDKEFNEKEHIFKFAKEFNELSITNAGIPK